MRIGLNNLFRGEISRSRRTQAASSRRWPVRSRQFVWLAAAIQQAVQCGQLCGRHMPQLMFMALANRLGQFVEEFQTRRGNSNLDHPSILVQPFAVDGLTPYITSNDDFYRIDTALIVPQIDPARFGRVTGPCRRSRHAAARAHDALRLASGRLASLRCRRRTGSPA